MFLELEQRLRRAVAERVTPAAAFGLSVGDAEPRLFFEGRRSHLPGAALAGRETVFDLASLTKPLTTVTWILGLVEAGRLSLETPIGTLVEVSDATLARTPLWRLLNHTTGLPAHREFFRGLLPRVRATGDTGGARTTVRRLVRQIALERAPGAAEVRPLAVTIAPEDLRAQVVRVEERTGGDTSGLTSAKVVVGAGRGAGGPDGFDDVIALAERLGGALGVSRVVTSLGWRPHHEQVGQTGSRISPDLYIPCGISGAIQHWAGCASSKTILAINTDPDAPMVTKATYAVVGDMHEVLPALLEELGSR